ncbi:protein RTM1 [Aspergillus udagawae]|uniref:Protein RTM1 n=1 Tax=Aspergillus udagawae TaxID=91492 RepID=A0ABQ1AKK1_9EURO|nr:protein RTM1 [Aspergillus udagawae]GFG05628.1 protein RTM1 [Aspergillus udagawae]
MASDKDNIYFYHPSLGASVLFTIIYIIPLLYQSYMTFIVPRKAQTARTKYFIPAVVGAALEVAGYALRCASVQKPADVSLYAVSNTLIVIAPVFVCASLYMLLGKLEVNCADGSVKKPANFLLRGSGRWLPWMFLSLDILAVLTQGSGSGIASSGNWKGSTKDTGIGVLIGGLVLQIVTFAAYLAIMVWFHWRATVQGHQLPHGVQMVMKGVYIAGFCIMLRSIYRVFEFAFGINSYTFTHEWPLYVLEAVPMLVALMVLGWFHPARWLAKSGLEGEEIYSLRKSSSRRRNTEEQSLA